MLYEIEGLPQIHVSGDFEGVYDNPKSAKSDLDYLRKQFPGVNLAILRDGVKLTKGELDADIKSYEIQTVREETSRLPSTYRHGRGTERDDVAVGVDGNPTKVWGPDNPEDRYE